MKLVRVLIALSFSFHLYSIDNPHFYRATFFWGEPRLKQAWMTSIDATVGGGRTRTSRNALGNKTSLLNYLGPFNMQYLGQNVPNLNPQNPLDAILINLNNLPENDGFAHLQFFGKFSTLEIILNGYQNIKDGFFFQWYLPIRKLQISDISFIDLSPDGGPMPNKNNPTWQAFLQNFPAILNSFDLSLKGADRIGAGDLTILGGWALNALPDHHFDYVDIDTKIGVLFPTGARRNENRPFDLPLGYNGHYAIALKFNMALGALEWITLGVHLGALFLFANTQNLRIKTAPEQNGLIKLTQAPVKIEPGNIWDVTTYVKADHLARGFSLLFGYAFSMQDPGCLELKTNLENVNDIIINSDTTYHQWTMHTLHFSAEYDLAEEPADIGPRIGFFYNYIVGGKRIFDTSIASSYLGFDIEWYF